MLCSSSFGQIHDNKNVEKGSNSLENLKINSLQAAISLSKVCQKPENHTSKMS
jgi:hypothetical protein